jgi:hypothetical protein
MKLFEPDDYGRVELYEDLPKDPASESQARSSLHGREFDGEAFEFLERLGAEIVERYVYVHGYRLDALIEGTNGSRFYVDAHGTPDRTDRPQSGMRRTDTMLKFGFKAMRLRAHECEYPLLLVTSHMPRPGSEAAFLLKELSHDVFDAVATVGDLEGQQRLRRYLHDTPVITEPLGVWWREIQLDFDSIRFSEGDDDA